MGKFIDLTGRNFGKLTVLGRAEKRAKDAFWLCQCECGNVCEVSSNHLTNGDTQSCGCFHRKRTSEVKLKDLTGQKFGRLTVIERAENDKGRHARWLCECECGKKCIVKSCHLLSGHSKSCSCLQKEKATKHGLWRDKIYNKWRQIKNRCFNPKCKNYKNYGARGITLFPAWVDDFKAFYDFVSTLEHFGEEGYSLDRINNDGNYEQGNLRWATKAEQARNRRSNVFVEYQGQEMSLAEASERSGISYAALRCRYHAGDTGERLFRPVER